MLIKLKKEVKNNKKDMTEGSYMNELMYKQFYSKFDIGIPSQKVKFYFETNVYESIISKDDYEKERSTTYKLIDKNKNDNKTEKNYLSQEILIFHPKKKLNNFTFLLKEKGTEEEKNISNIFGLNMNVNNKNESLSFLHQLKQVNFINKKMFSFLFDDYVIGNNNGFDGQILMGCFPHEINSLYDEKDLRWISSKHDSTTNGSWHIDFDTVKYNNDTLIDKKANLDLSLNVIIGPENFRKKLLSDFFKINMEKKNCKENVFYSLKDEEHYIYYSCNGQTEFIEIPTLSFYNKELNYKFILDYDDLFLEKRNGYYFLIAFTKEFRSTWKIGFPFFKKYKFIFDQESKSVGFYCPDGCADGNSQIKQNSFDYKKFFIIFGIIVGAIIILIIGRGY